MDVKLLNKTENKIAVVIDKVTPEFMNEFRRTAMFKVPTMAIEDVFFTKNSSALYDEMIALRLGLTPLKVNPSEFNIQKDCTCRGKGCGKCQLKIKLAVQGPAMVMAKDMKIWAGKAEPVFPETPITLLLENQILTFEATAVLGTGQEHVKWSPGLAYYFNFPKGGKGNDAEALRKQLDLEEAESVDNKYVFVFESWGQMKAEDVLKLAAKLMQIQFKELKI